MLQQGGVGLLLALSLFAVGLLIAAGLSGPVVSPRWAMAAWAGCILPAVGMLTYAWLRLRRHRGRGAARLLSHHAPELSTSVRSALELSDHLADDHSPDLIGAHVASVARRVGAVPVGEALPWRDLRGPTVGLGLLVCLLAAGLLLGRPDLTHGVIALLYPAHKQADGMLLAPIVESISARLIYPSYLRRDPEPVPDPDHIVAPVGTTVELRLQARLPAQEVMLVVGPQRMRLSRQEGDFFGRIVARTDAALEVQLRSDGQWYRDASERSLRALSDHVPLIEISEPSDGAWVHADQGTNIRFRANDSEGLSSVDLAIRLPDGHEVRRTVWSGIDAATNPSQLAERFTLVPGHLGVRQGDRFELWLEASDGDVVTGPNVGRSKTITLEALSDARFLSQHLPFLKQVLDLSVAAVADRLEAPVPPEADRARKRFQQLRVSENAWLSALDELVAGLAQQETETLGLDDSQLAAIGERYRRKRRRDSQLHRVPVAGQRARTRADSELVEELERDVLLLADLLAQAHLDEANALADELKNLKARIQDLLHRLSESDDEEARRELLAEVARAERRLKDLIRSMAQLATHVPSEFVNQQALDQPSSTESMNDLRSSVQEGDLDAAARHLEDLEQRLDQLAKGLQSGGLRFREARFGERDKAMMEARQKLAMLSEEQGRLAQQSTDQTRRVLERAGQGQQTPGTSQGLQGMADDVQKRLSSVSDKGLGLGEQRTFDQAQARLRDTRDALRTGDLAEAQRMAAASERALQQLAGNLENDARMFPGHDGHAADNARAARQADEAMKDLERAISQQTPRMSDHLNQDDRRRLRRLAESQKAARKAADSLRGKLAKGPEGLPLSPEGADAVERAQNAMRRAEGQLQRDDPQAAALAQEEAADELRQLSEQLARKQSGGAQGAAGGRRDGSARSALNGRVEIPDAKDFEAPTARRRRLLDAMREGSPPGYEAAVGAYYRELLR